MSALPSTHELLETAIEAATAAGLHALHNSARRREVHKAFQHDVKLQLDLECQQTAEHLIHARFPDHRILGEEDDSLGAQGPTRSRVLWIIDPIDGTVNFSHGYPAWCCSIGVFIDGAAVAGAVYAPVHDELYTATHQTRSLCNGRPLHVSTTPSLDQAIVMAGFDRHPDAHVPPLTILGRLVQHCQRPRINGCAALDICLVAAGRADAYFESGIYLWDIAAAGLIIQQAGGRTQTVGTQGPGHRLNFLATNGLVHEALLALVKPTGAQA